jgi:crotonobetainyl-CoA:carnitine CoA-transferase CaiB-like acyl-CoA transferase
MKSGFIVPTTEESVGVPAGCVAACGFGAGTSSACAAAADFIFNRGCDTIVIWGTAGGLSPELRNGDIVVGNRVAHKDEIEEILESWSRQLTATEVVDALLANGIPAGPLLSIRELSTDPHFNDHRGMFPYMEQPGVGPFRVTAMPIQFSETPATITRHAPALGEHNDEVYGELLGMTAEEVSQLKENGII